MMTPEEMQKLKALYVATALYYGHDIPDEALKLYVEDLKDLDFEDVARAMGDVRRDPKTSRCPMPAILRAKVEHSVSPEQEADYLVGLIVHAISRVGPYQTPHLPPVAMELVRLEGGWAQICEMVTNDNLSTYRAQWRRLVTVLLLKKKSPGESFPQLEGGPAIDIKSLLPEFPKEDPK